MTTLQLKPFQNEKTIQEEWLSGENVLKPIIKVIFLLFFFFVGTQS